MVSSDGVGLQNTSPSHPTLMPAAPQVAFILLLFPGELQQKVVLVQLKVSSC